MISPPTAIIMRLERQELSCEWMLRGIWGCLGKASGHRARARWCWRRRPRSASRCISTCSWSARRPKLNSSSTISSRSLKTSYIIGKLSLLVRTVFSYLFVITVCLLPVSIYNSLGSSISKRLKSCKWILHKYYNI